MTHRALVLVSVPNGMNCNIPFVSLNLCQLKGWYRSKENPLGCKRKYFTSPKLPDVPACSTVCFGMCARYAEENQCSA